MNRRQLLGSVAAAACAPRFAAAQEKAQRAIRGLSPVTIRDIRVLTTSAGSRYQWVFVKVLTSEPGLYGVGSASNVEEPMAIATNIEKHFAQFWIGRDVDRIDDVWMHSNHHVYRRGGAVLNCCLSGLDMALWDIKGKRAGMPVYDLLGGKVRDAVPVYGHADGRDMQQVSENVRKFMDQGYVHVRAQMGGYGGGGMFAPGEGHRPRSGFNGPAFDEEKYAVAIPKLMEYLRTNVSQEVKLIHDVHEHLSPTMAVEFAKRMEPYRMFYVEDILPPEQISWFANIRQVTSTPMAMGELFVNQEQWVRLITDRLIDFIRCRVSSIGGITPARKVAILAETFGVRTAWQEGGDHDPVNQIAAYHIDMASLSFGIQEDNRFAPSALEMFPGIGKIEGGYLYGTNTPGLGIDIDEKLVAKYPMIVNTPKEDGFTVRALDGSPVRP